MKLETNVASSDKLKVVVRGKAVWIADGTEAEGQLGFFRVHGDCDFPEIYVRAFELLVATEEGLKMFRRYQEPYIWMDSQQLEELKQKGVLLY